MEDRTKLREYIRNHLATMKSIRQRGDDRRVLCCEMLNYRLDDLHSPVSRRKLYSPIAIDAILTTQRGMAGYMLSPSIRWFRFVTKGSHFEPSDALYGANDWLELVENLIYAVFSNSRFYSNSLMALGDCLIVGTSYEMVTDEVINGQIIYDCFSPFECYIAEDGQRNVNTFYREYRMTADEAYAKWGKDTPKDIIDLCNNESGSTECEFIHAIFPRDNAEIADVPVPAAGSKRYASVHYSTVGNTVFKVSGYDDFPVAVHRYRLVDGTPYGASLASDNLELIIEDDDLWKKYNKATAKLVDPPVWAPTSLRGRVALNAGSILYGNTQEGEVKPIATQIDINALAQHKNEVDAMLNRLLFSDLFNVLMRQERQRTAYEVQELKGEGLVLLSAIIGNMQVEKLNPLVLRTFNIMYRNGMLPEAPDELKKAWAQGRVQIELEGPLAQTMRQYHQTTGLAQGMQWISSWAQLFPQSMSNIDGDEGMRQGATSFGWPQSAIRERADVEKIRRQQMENEQRAQQQQEALAQSQVAKNLGVDAQQLAQAMASQGSDAQQMLQNGRGIGA